MTYIVGNHINTVLRHITIFLFPVTEFFCIMRWLFKYLGTTATLWCVSWREKAKGGKIQNSFIIYFSKCDIQIRFAQIFIMNIEINWCIDIHILHLIPFRLISANEFIIKPIFVRMAKYFLCINDQANSKKKVHVNLIMNYI